MRNLYSVRFILVLCLLLIVSFDGLAQIPYDLQHPSERVVLPPVLREVSGVTAIDSVTVAFVQDEKGVIYLYSLKTHAIVREIPFAADGDFEGLARAGGDMYVLRSDGVLFGIRDYASKPAITSYTTHIPCANSEGLCYDATGKRLLLACKSPLGKGKEYKDERGIFAFDPDGKQPATKAFELSLTEVRQFCATHRISLPTITRKNGTEKEQLRIRLSALAIRPGTNDIYLLSAADHLLLVLDATGTLKEVVQLDATLYNKAEGIIFLPNGDLVITNEGQQGQATLLRIEM